MCGICLILNSGGSLDFQEICCHDNLRRRGPDAQNGLEVEISPGLGGYFYGTTLHFRGELTKQPLVDSAGNILLWNGEIFNGIEVMSDENDGEVLLSLLRQLTSSGEILEVLSRLRGPWAFLYYQKSRNELWFGRDIFGRRSLVCHHDESTLAFSSVKLPALSPWREVPALGIYCMKLSRTTRLPDNVTSRLPDNVTLYPWVLRETPSQPGVVDSSSATEFNVTLRGQTDWTLCDIQTGQHGISSPFLPFNPNIPLINQVTSESRTEASDSTSTADRNAAKDKKDSVEISDLKLIEQHRTPSRDDLSDKLIEVLGKAVETRVKCQADICGACLQARYGKRRGELTELGSDKRCGHVRLAVLFSGGIDSLVIAALADRFVPEDEPIDLLNVAFAQQPKLGNPNQKGKKTADRKKPADVTFDPYDVPDRVTGLSAYHQLQKVSPTRKWNFIKVDVPLLELQELREKRVRDLVYPLNTVLDDSIGCAVWFAARGTGEMAETSGEAEPSTHTTSYTTTGRVVLVGMGADEQLAGYSRHRVRFKSGGWDGLVDEIKMEIERISSRNLGRDDRIISDHGREARFPFLDESVVSFLNSVPIRDKADLTLPRGVGEKYLLRLCAVKLGLEELAVLPKRAIQFGSRIAKAENKKESGSDVCGRLATTKIS